MLTKIILYYYTNKAATASHRFRYCYLLLLFFFYFSSIFLLDTRLLFIVVFFSTMIAIVCITNTIYCLANTPFVILCLSFGPLYQLPAIATTPTIGDSSQTQGKGCHPSLSTNKYTDMRLRGQDLPSASLLWWQAANTMYTSLLIIYYSCAVLLLQIC